MVSEPTSFSPSALKPSAEFSRDAVYLVDSSSYIFRAYYAIRAALTAPDGTPTHATFGFMQMFLSLMESYKPHRLVFVWDHKAPGFRQEIYTAYKANRSAPPEDLGVQIENTKKGLELIGLHQLEMPGFEADDIMATMVRKNPEANFVIVTSDKDLLQLVSPRVWCLDTMKNQWGNHGAAVDKFGVEPELVADVQALSGDTVDNIKGAPGIGPKTATELIRHFGSLEKLLKEAAERKAQNRRDLGKDDPLRGKRLDAIADNLEQIRLSYRLVKLHEEVPLKDARLENFELKTFQRQAFEDWAKSLGFKNLANRLGPSPAAEEPKIETPPQALDWKPERITSLEKLGQVLEAAEKAPRLAFDTETFALDAHKPENLVGLSLAFEPGRGFYLPVRHQTGENLPVPEVLSRLDRFFRGRGEDFRLVFQNAKFDLHVLAGERFTLPEKLAIDDTMVMSYVLSPAEGHGMDELSNRYLGYNPQSFTEVLGEADNFSQVDLERATFYSAEDAVVTLRLEEVLRKKLGENSLWKVYELLDRPLIQVLFEMERTGVSIDVGYLQELSGQLRGELHTREMQARALLAESGLELDPALNLGSTKQVAAILYEKLKLPILKRGKTGPSTDVRVLEELQNHHPFPRALLEIRELSKLLSTYVDALPQLIDAHTGRVHTEFSQTVAGTGRLSSSNPNLQNIPIRTERGKKIRHAVRASPGTVLVGIDYSQAELRILAHVSQDPELLRAFKEGADIHRRTASLILHKPENELSDDERRIAKTINFGIIYGQSAFGLSKQLKIPKAEAQAFIDRYFATYGGIKTYMERAIREAKDSGAVRTLSQRRRPIPEIHSRNGALRQFGERMAINSPIQGTAADIMKAAMIEVRRRLRQDFPEAKLLLQVHDELLFEVPEKGAADLQRAVTAAMEDQEILSRTFGIPRFEVVMKAEGSSGLHWGAL